MNFLERQQQKLKAFFTVPVSPVPLSVLRVLVASFVIFQAILWHNDWLAFFGQDAWIQWEISEALIPDLSIHIADVTKFLGLFGLNEDQSVILFYWIYLVSAVMLLLGWYTRIWAILTWFCHYVLMLSMEVYVYGVDIFTHIALFYIMIMPVSRRFSLDARLGHTKPEGNWRTTLCIRVLQIHLSLTYISAGYEKFLAPGWWDGNVMWRSLVQPDFNQFNLTWLSEVGIIPKLLSWFTIITETGYCIAMWIPKVRVFWLAAVIMLHFGIGMFLGLWLFGIIMIIMSVSAFGYDAYCDIRKWQMNKKLKKEKKQFTISSKAA